MAEDFTNRLWSYKEIYRGLQEGFFKPEIFKRSILYLPGVANIIKDHPNFHEMMVDVYHAEPEGVTFSYDAWTTRMVNRPEMKECRVAVYGNDESIGEFEKRLIDWTVKQSLKGFQSIDQALEQKA